MDNYIYAFLFDIKKSIDEVESYFPTGKVFQTYQEDLKTRRAVERNIEIIGEAMSRILNWNLRFKYPIQEKSLMPETELFMVTTKFLMM